MGWSAARKNVKEFAEITSLHGFPDLSRTDSIFLKLIWIVILVIAYAVCLHETLMSIILYRSQEVDTKIENHPLTDLPKLTLCSPVFTDDGQMVISAPGTPDLLFYRVDRHVKLFTDSAGSFTDVMSAAKAAAAGSCATSSAGAGTFSYANYEANQLAMTRDEQRYFKWKENSIGWNGTSDPGGSDTYKMTFGERSLPRHQWLPTRALNCYTSSWSPSLSETMPNLLETRIRKNNQSDASLSVFLFFDNEWFEGSGWKYGSPSPALAESDPVILNTFTFMVDITKRYRVKDCVQSTEYEQERKRQVCYNDVMQKYAQCCICGYGLECPMTSADCCIDSSVDCHVEDEAFTRALLACDAMVVYKTCEETKFKTLLVKGQIEGDASGREEEKIMVAFQNTRNIIVVRESLRYDLGYILGRVGGIMGLLIGGSIISFLQIPLFCAEKLTNRQKVEDAPRSEEKEGDEAEKNTSDGV